ncbi:MAG TPA: flagellar basal body-associated FliL family protein [Desulfotignum sp.]|nr:flagellar basal body-associated FliL family protein [Desulfotignum sp.]
MARTLLENMDEEQGEQAADQPKKNMVQKFTTMLHAIPAMGKKIILIGGSVLVVFLTAGVWLFLSAMPDTDKKDMAAHTIAAENLVEQDRVTTMRQIMDETVFTDIVSLEPFERLLLKGSSAMAHVNMALALELIDPDIRQQLDFMTDRIHAIVQDQVRRLTWLELRTPEGKIQLKYNLLTQINSLFSAPVVRNVYFTKFLMR